jgi:histone deacetylase 6
MVVTPACYAHLVHSLSHLACGKIAVVLEVCIRTRFHDHQLVRLAFIIANLCLFLQGGYFLKSLAEGAALTLRSLLGDACPTIGSIGEIDNR